MNKAFSGMTRLEAAVQGLNKVLNLQVAERDNLAFRHFGGPCRGYNTKLLVNFGQNNAHHIREALGILRIDGETTTADAVIKAIKDFDDINRFEGVSKRALIITGGNDSCILEHTKLFDENFRTGKSGQIFGSLDWMFLLINADN